MMPRVHLIHVARVQVTSCIHLYRLSPSIHVSGIGDKIVVNGALRRHVSTCIRIHVARPGYLYPATCIWCKRGLSKIIQV